MKEFISVVVPVYMGEPFLEELVERLESSLPNISSEYEILLINDCSPDASWEILQKICATQKCVKGINLSRNFGQHYAISAGLSHSKGDFIVVMDCDLQDVPEEIGSLFSKAQEGYDVVLAQRQTRNDSALKRLFSFMFYQLLSWLTGVKYDHKVANFGLYRRKVIDAILSMGDSIRYFPSMVKWVGFKSTAIEVKHSARAEGKSSYNFKRLTNLALDIVLSYSDKPLRLVIKGGTVISFFSLMATIYTFIRAISGKIEVPGYASMIISIWFFSGLIIAIIGVVGLYVSKTFQAARRRPVFIVSEVLNN